MPTGLGPAEPPRKFSKNLARPARVMISVARLSCCHHRCETRRAAANSRNRWLPGMAANEIAHRGGDLLRVLQHEHMAAALDLSHFAIRQSVRESRSSFRCGHDASSASKYERRRRYVWQDGSEVARFPRPIRG